MTIISAAESSVEAVAGVATKAVPFYYKILGYIAVATILIGIGAAPTAYYVRKYEVDYYTTQIQAADLAAQTKITELTAQKAAVDLELAGVKNDIQTKYVAAKQVDADAIAKLNATNARLWVFIANKGGNSTSSNPAGSTSSGADSSSTAVVLPQQLSDSVLSLAGQADGVAEQLRACQSWVTQSKAALDKWAVDNKINQPVTEKKRTGLFSKKQ